jgi:hypothetical protein
MHQKQTAIPTVIGSIEAAPKYTALDCNMFEIDEDPAESPAPRRSRRVGIALVGVGLTLAALVGASGLFFVVLPVFRTLLAPKLPSCRSREVVKLVEDIIRKSPGGAECKFIDGHHEVSYDRAKDRRTGQCVAHIDDKDIVVSYIVQWRDPHRGQFEVVVPPISMLVLPSCTSLEVVRLLETVIRKSPVGAKVKSIDGHREVSYDRAKERRKGECVTHTDGGDIVVKYFVRWQDKEKTHFEVGVPSPDLPECTSRTVVQLLEKVIRGTPEGAKATSIGGHREIRYDRAQDRRTGQCVVRLNGEDVVVEYIVEWRDREAGQFEVLIPE